MAKKPTKPTIVVRYYGGEQPIVELPKGLKAKIQFINQDAEDTLILTHNGVSVYWATKDLEYGNYQVSDVWCTTFPMESSESDRSFDPIDLPGPPEHLAGKYEAKFSGDSDKQKLAYLIDIKAITEDGLSLETCDECRCAIPPADPDDGEERVEPEGDFHERHCSLYKAPAGPESEKV